MSVDDYEYELMRAELLGLPPPEKPAETRKKVEEEHTEDGEPSLEEQELEVQDEKIRNASGGLDELNSILTVTQKKLNKFKVVCGSLTNLLKIKVAKEEGNSSNCSSSRASIISDDGEKKAAPDPPAETDPDPAGEKPLAETSMKTLDISEKINSQIDRLDAMVMKAETAEMRLSHQSKQIKSFLK